MRNLLRVECLAVQKEFGIELAGAPTCQYLPYGADVDSQQIGDRLKIWRQRHNSADIEIRIRPAIQSASDARKQRIVYGGMTKRALNPNGGEMAGLIKKASQANNRVQFQESQSRYRAVEVYRAVSNGLTIRSRQSVHIDFEAELQCGAWRQTAAHAAQGNTFNCAMQLKRAAPEILIAKCIESECLSAFGDQSFRVFQNCVANFWFLAY